MIDQYDDHFRDGIEAIGRLFGYIWTGFTLVVGGTAMVLFAILVSPIAGLGWIVRHCGFQSRW